MKSLFITHLNRKLANEFLRICPQKYKSILSLFWMISTHSLRLKYCLTVIYIGISLLFVV